ncbi:hypothetical protein Tco_0822084 [Tanacetum coccineum]|uniref:Uncharacterized protein n=1 Tax=Tanacetum coccineum TaxID=301880 RepID=A0ABQ5AE55_9ASTR
MLWIQKNSITVITKAQLPYAATLSTSQITAYITSVSLHQGAVENGVSTLYLDQYGITIGRHLTNSCPRKMNFYQQAGNAEYYAGYTKTLADEVDETGAFVLHAYVSYSKKIDLQSATSHKTHAIFKIADQNALDEHWWAPADRLKIGNVIYAKFSYVTSKEANPSSGLRWLSSQPFNKAFPVTAMLPEIYSRNSGLCLSSLLDLVPT